MSMKTWREEFYPITAKDASSGTDVQAVEHSLQKWLGLRKEARDKHGVRVTPGGVITGPALEAYELPAEEWLLNIDAKSCALCERHLIEQPGGGRIDCATCPLAKVRAQSFYDWIACDNPRIEEEVSPFTAWTRNADPEPMISWLGRALEYANEHKESGDASPSA